MTIKEEAEKQTDFIADALPAFKSGFKSGYNACVRGESIQALVDAVKFLHPRCEECGELAFTCYDTEGDGRFWLCDKRDESHSIPDRYSGHNPLRFAALEAWERATK